MGITDSLMQASSGLRNYGTEGYEPYSMSMNEITDSFSDDNVFQQTKNAAVGSFMLGLKYNQLKAGGIFLKGLTKNPFDPGFLRARYEVSHLGGIPGSIVSKGIMAGNYAFTRNYALPKKIRSFFQAGESFETYAKNANAGWLEKGLIMPKNAVNVLSEFGHIDKDVFAQNLSSEMRNVYGPGKARFRHKSSANLFGHVNEITSSDKRHFYKRNAVISALGKQGMPLTKGQSSQIDTFLKGMKSRNRILNGAKAIIGHGALAYLAIPAVAWGLKKIPEIIGRSSATIKDMMKTEFGGGTVIESSRLGSERQKQIAAIQNSGLNARGLMGNEAKRYHQ